MNPAHFIWAGVVLSVAALAFYAARWRWRDQDALGRRVSGVVAGLGSLRRDFDIGSAGLANAVNDHGSRLTALEAKARELEQLVKPDPNPKPAAPRRSA